MSQPIVAYNQKAWDAQVRKHNRWTIPVDAETIHRARNQDYAILLTPDTPVPKKWLEPVENKHILCLASGGGQQGPILAAAGAKVTALDQSIQQLRQDCFVAAREHLTIDTVQGDMLNLNVFADQSFDLIINPVSTCFVPDVNRVYRHVARLLKPKGRFMTGFINPIYHIFDYNKMVTNNEFVLRHSLPYSDYKDLSQNELDELINDNEPLIFSHTMQNLLGGQLQAGLVITDFFEDSWKGQPLDRFTKLFMATLAIKL